MSWSEVSRATLGVYIGFLLAVIVCVGFSFVKLRSASNQQATHIFFTFIVAFAVTRVMWVIADAQDYEYTNFILNRVAFACFFTAFTAVVFFWVEMYDNMRRLRAFDFSRRYAAFIGTNIFLWTVQAIFVILLIARGIPKTREESKVYDGNIIGISVITLAIALAFLGYGFMIAWKFYKAARSVHSSGTRRAVLIRITATASVFVLCFSVRVAMFSYRPATNKFLNKAVFYTFAYIVPEVVPSLCELYLLLVQRARSHESRAVTSVEDSRAGGYDELDGHAGPATRDSISESFSYSMGDDYNGMDSVSPSFTRPLAMSTTPQTLPQPR